MGRYNRIIGMMYSDESNSFVSTWNTANTSTGSSTSTRVKLPLVSGGTYNFVVNWGDGNSDIITVWNAASTTHTYSSSGTYTITITGICTGWQFNGTGDRLKFLSVSSWGGLRIIGQYAFNGCANLNLNTVSDLLDLGTAANALVGMFWGCSSLTSVNRINEWNTSNCTSTYLMFYMFGVSSVFNQALSFDTTTITNMQGMFVNCAALNSPINFNTSNVTDMLEMFRGCTIFNQDVSSFDVSKVTTFSQMFYLASAFNNGGSSNINNWTLKNSGTINMTGMFRSCPFNQPIGNWNTTFVTTMSNMFNGNTSFNQNIGNWIVSNCDNFSNMFFSATSFNNGGSTDINNWTLKTTGTINFTSMFQNASNFNQPLYSWNTIVVNTMASMFSGATQFNNGYANGVAGTMSWDMSSVLSTEAMFNAASNFNQNLGNLVFTNCADFSSMFQNASKYDNGSSSDINNWVFKTTGTITMQSMFSGATIFNQNIGNWNAIVVNNLATFMSNKTYVNYSASNLNSIYNNWTNRLAIAALTTTFGTIKYTKAAIEGRALLTRTNSTKSITNAVNNGSGLIRISATAHGLSTGNKCFISGVLGTTEANGAWTVTVIDADTIDLQASTFTNTYTSAGTLRTGYGWTITDGTLNVTATSNNGGLIRVTCGTHGFTTGQVVYIYGVNGTTNANGSWTVTVVNSTIIELQGSSYNAAWTSGGNVILD